MQIRKPLNGRVMTPCFCGCAGNIDFLKLVSHELSLIFCSSLYNKCACGLCYVKCRVSRCVVFMGYAGRYWCSPRLKFVTGVAELQHGGCCLKFCIWMRFLRHVWKNSLSLDYKTTLKNFYITPILCMKFLGVEFMRIVFWLWSFSSMFL